jgi:hypothetical protein
MMMWWPKKFYYCFYGIVFLDMAGPYHAFFLSSPAVFNAIYSNSRQGYAIHCVVGANHIWNWMGNMKLSFKEFHTPVYTISKIHMFNTLKSRFSKWATKFETISHMI